MRAPPSTRSSRPFFLNEACARRVLEHEGEKISFYDASRARMYVREVAIAWRRSLFNGT